MRVISPEAKKLLAISGQEKRRIVSWFPVDPPNCECWPAIIEARKEPSKVRYITCPRNKKGLKQYLILCKNCGSEIAQLWAKDKTLKDWCDLHYISEHDSEQWFGCVGVNISPVDGQLGFECACGEDTRDFRANTILSSKALSEKIKETEKGREFNKKDSKFSVKEIK